MEVTRCRFGNTSRQIVPAGYEDLITKKNWPPILHAVYHNREAALHHFLQAGVSPEDTGGTGVPLLCVAAACGHLEVTRILLETGAVVNSSSKDKGETALHIAVRGSQHDIVDLLLAHGINLEVKTVSTGETALHYAAAGSNSLTLAMKLLRFGAKYDVKNLEGQTPAEVALQAHNLHAAIAIINMARGKRSQLVKEKEMLLKHVEGTNGQSSVTNDLIADVFTATCDPDSTVLIEAVKKKDVRLVETFLEKGADPHRGTAKGQLPILLAVELADLRTIKLLVQHGADVTIKDSGNLTLLQVFFKTSLEQDEDSILGIVKYLFSKGVDGLALYPDGKTLLHRIVSASADYARVAKLLLREGVDINAQDGSGNTALHLAASNGLANTTSFLLESRADIRIVDYSKRTPLLCAIQHQKLSLISLLAIPPVITSWDVRGSTPLHHIARSIPKDSVTWMDVAAAAKTLCERGVCRSMRDRSGATPLIQAVRVLPEEGLPVVKALLTEGGKSNNCIGHEDHKQRNALYYAATLGKLIFVEVLLKHGAPFVLKEWTDGARQSKLPVAVKSQVLKLITESHLSRQELAPVKQNDSIQEKRIDDLSSKTRSGPTIDYEIQRKSTTRHNVGNNVKTLSRQRRQNSDPRPNPQAPSLTLPNRTPNRQQRLGEAAAEKSKDGPRRRATVSMAPVKSSADQSLHANAISSISRKRADQPKTIVRKDLPAQKVRNSIPDFSSRTLNRQQTAVTKPALRLSIQPNKMTATGIERPQASVSTTTSTGLVATEETRTSAIAVARTTQAPKTSLGNTKTAANTLKPAALSRPQSLPKPANPLKVPVSKKILSTVDDSKPVQPSRADSGVSLKHNNSTAEILHSSNRPKTTFDSSVPKTKRQSDNELASWLAISSMLDKL